MALSKAEVSRRYRERHPELIKQRQREYDKKRHSDPIGREKRRASSRNSHRKYRAQRLEKMRISWANRNPDDIRDYNLRYAHGISLDDVKALEKSQNNQCAICHETTKLVVDHDHDTEQIRELLCNNCNMVLGLMHEDIMKVKGLLAYIEKWKTPKGIDDAN